ncbi:hypothetical protein DY000_02021216 [Brassica cretica]|uniref:Uncharacterized protein n=1 Tax=Brassica cretica TaxID=69181 RepID=A0ABQ7EB83_BRACR|nr:hypothetical protein DY000_02021216 [Brassica cretica]
MLFSPTKSNCFLRLPLTAKAILQLLLVKSTARPATEKSNLSSSRTPLSFSNISSTKGSPYRKSSISWNGGRSLGLVPGFLLAGTWSIPLSGTGGPGSCPKSGGNDTGDSAPSVSLSWVPLKPDLILNPGKDWFLLIWPEPNSSVLNFLEMTRLERVLVGENRSLQYALESLGPEKPFLPILSVSEMKAESGLSPDSSSIGSRVRSSKVNDVVAPSVSMDSSDSSMDLTAEVEDPKAIVARNILPVVEGNRYPPIGPPSVIGVEEVSDWRMKYNLPADFIIRVPGFRDRVPSLVAKISETLEISPGQLNPPAWRTLIALHNLGDLQGLVIGVAEVLCSYSVSPLSVAEWRYYLRPRGKEPPVREVPKRERKRLPVFSGNWTEKFAFMRLPGFLPIWQLEGEMSGSKGDEVLAEYKKALEFLRSSKRLTVAATAPSSSKKKSKASGSYPSASYDWTTVLTNLNTKVFPSTPVLLASEEDSSVAIQSLQGDLLQVASQLFHLGERMVGAALTKAEMDALASHLREEKDVALAKDKEIKALRLKARNQEEAKRTGSNGECLSEESAKEQGRGAERSEGYCRDL